MAAQFKSVRPEIATTRSLASSYGTARRRQPDTCGGTYPTGWLEEHTIPPFEEAEEVSRLRPLVRALQATALMTVDAQLGTDGGLMVNQLYLGEQDAPSWGELNLDFHDSRRLAEVQAREAGLGSLLSG